MKSITVKLDLYDHTQIEKNCKLAAKKLGIDAEGMEADMQQLMELLERHKYEQIKKGKPSEGKIEVEMATASKCLAFLRQKNLIKEFDKLIEQAGITGEKTNRILLFVIASSYKMPKTLHGLIQGSSGSGKSRLLKIILDLMPPEDVKRYTRVTDNSFYNQGEYFFVRKLVGLEDMDGLKEDAQLAVRELMSNEILISSTSLKDKDGTITGGERIVRGPIASLACTTNGELYEDNVSRCFLVAVDESKEQTLRVIKHQNDTAAGIIRKEDQRKAKAFCQNCIRMLKSYEVVNLYSNKVQLPDYAHKIRRLNELYQSFVQQITLLNQYQRKKDKYGRLIAEVEDLKTACEILFESIVLKVDELDGSLRQFYEQLKGYVKDDKTEFSQRELRQAFHISKSRMQRYIQRLLDFGYIVQSGGYINRGLRYRIDYRDNYAMMRAKIKEDLMSQIRAVKNGSVGARLSTKP